MEQIEGLLCIGVSATDLILYKCLGVLSPGVIPSGWLGSEHQLTNLGFRSNLCKIFFFFFYNCIVPLGLLQWEIRVAFPGENRLRQSHATQPTVHAGCYSVCTIHRTLTWTTGSLTCSQRRTPLESLHRKLSLWEKKKIPYRTGESNLSQRHGGPTLYQHERHSHP